MKHQPIAIVQIDRTSWLIGAAENGELRLVVACDLRNPELAAHVAACIQTAVEGLNPDELDRAIERAATRPWPRTKRTDR